MQTFLPIIFLFLFLNARSSTNFKDPILSASEITNASQLLPESFLQYFRSSDSYKEITLSSGEKIMIHEVDRYSRRPHVFAILHKNNTVIAYGKLPWRDTHLNFELFIIGLSAFLERGELTITDNHNVIETFLKAQNLKGCKKCFICLRYILTIPFIKYLIYTSNFYYKCLDIVYQKMPESWHTYTPLRLFVHLLFCGDPGEDGEKLGAGELCLFVFFGLLINPLCTYLKHMIIFHIKTLPFHALTLPIELLYLDEKYISVFTHCAFRLAIFFPYSSLFPSILNTIMFLVPSFQNIDAEEFLPSLVDSFEIEPKNKMFAFPFLIERKRSCKFCFLILFFEIFYSLLFIIGFRKWIPLNNGEYGE